MVEKLLWVKQYNRIYDSTLLLWWRGEVLVLRETESNEGIEKITYLEA